MISFHSDKKFAADLAAGLSPGQAAKEQSQVFPDGGECGTGNPAPWLAQIAPDWAEEALLLGTYYGWRYSGWWTLEDGKWRHATCVSTIDLDRNIHVYRHNEKEHEAELWTMSGLPEAEPRFQDSFFLKVAGVQIVITATQYHEILVSGKISELKEQLTA